MYWLLIITESIILGPLGSKLSWKISFLAHFRPALTQQAENTLILETAVLVNFKAFKTPLYAKKIRKIPCVNFS